MLRPSLGTACLLALCSLAGPFLLAEEIQRVTESLSVVNGPVNGALIRRNGKILAIYGDPRERPAKADLVLFTHHRRDVVWAGRDLVRSGAVSVVPAREERFFAEVRNFWIDFVETRFHDYEQQSTKILAEPIPAGKSVRGGDQFSWEGVPIRVLETPGYTRGSVTYLVQIDGKKFAFTGDLIYGDGRLLDWYSLQDSIPGISRGYHGYGARSAQLIESLRAVAREEPDLLIPARGPIVDEVEESVARLISRIRSVYENYLAISAYSWYIGKPKAEALAARVLGTSHGVNRMGSTETDLEDLPDWIIPIQNSRLIVAEDRSGFLIDCGSRSIIDHLLRMRAEGQLSVLEGIYVTHYHDDHTDQIPALLKEFRCPVYASAELHDVLQNPQAYRLPAMTSHPIEGLNPMEEGSQLEWKEFDLTFNYLPGQTIYHGALTVTKNGKETICLVGDSFTPTGIDDYCPQNRNFLHPGMGYLRSLDFLRRLSPETFLINQHVEPMFRFSPGQLDRMEQNLISRVGLLHDLFPWEDLNFGLDEGWARFAPYSQSLKPGTSADQELRIFNHSDRELRCQVKLNLPRGWGCHPEQTFVQIDPKQEGKVSFQVSSPEATAPGVHILTADIAFDGWQLREWTEGLVIIEGP